MAKFDVTAARVFRRVFVCRRCKAKLRTDSMRIKNGLAKCRNCASRAFRPIKSKK